MEVVTIDPQVSHFLGSDLTFLVDKAYATAKKVAGPHCSRVLKI
jgi:hypothetical protein